MVPSLSLGKLSSKSGLVVVNSPVSVAEKAESDDIDLWPDIDLTCDLL